MAASIASITDALEDQEKKINRQKNAWDSTKKSVDAIVKSTRQISVNVITATEGLLKWVGIGATFASTIASGSVFGIDKLAQSIGDSRRVAQGLGISTGALQSANLNLGRYVDTNSVLGNIADAQSDLGRRYAFGQLGISGSGTPDQIIGSVIQAAKKLYDSGGTTVQAYQSRGLQNFMSFEEFRRIGQNSPGDIAKSIADFKKDRAQLQLNDKTQKDFQDFAIQIERATLQLKQMLAEAIGPLIPSLSKLSQVVVESVKTFIKTVDLKSLIENLGKGITWFANEINQESFRKGIVDFIDKIKEIVEGLDNLLKFLHIIPGGDNKPPPTTRVPGTHLAFPTHPMGGSSLGDFWALLTGRHNPGNLKDLSGNFRHFANDNEGLAAMSNLLVNYEYGKRQADTIRKIINTYAPASDHNNVGAYIDDVVKRTGIGADAKLNLHDQNQLIKLIMAMTHHENKKNNFSAAQVKIAINNNTGGNANTTANQAAVAAGH